MRINNEVCGIDRVRRKIQVNNRITGQKYEEAYDELVLSPGSAPICPKLIKGVSLPHVFTVRNVSDIVKLDRYLNRENSCDVVVVGGGFIGLEVAENLKKAGKNVSVVEAAGQVMNPFDYDMSQILHKELCDNDVELILRDGIKAITEDKVFLNSERELPADVVVLAIGVLPDTTLAKEAGLEII